jgi:hypothetical protein
MKRQLGEDVRRLVISGVALFVLATIAYGTLRLTFGPRPVYVHVRWAASADEATRRQLEQRYGLTQRELREGTTWGYALTNLSRDNISALVADSAVEDTHQIHRTAFRVGYFAPRLPYQTSRPWVPIALEILSALFLLTGLAAVGLAALTYVAPRAVRGPLLTLRSMFLAPRATTAYTTAALLAWIRSRIPDASPEAAALFRIVFGVALLIFVLERPVGDGWTTGQTNVLSRPHQIMVSLFRGAPSLAAWISPWVAVWGSLFIAGAFTRTAFALTSVGVFAWAILYTTRVTYHTVCALLVTLLCLLWARWGDAWSVDALLRRKKIPRAAPKEYGFVVWMPGLTLGVIFAAAAFAKLRESGLAWILNGTVKYHFLSDSRQAMVDWGLQLGRYHSIAVLLSFGAIAIESLVIVGALSRLYRYRLLAGVSALALLAGFSLLQGLFWPGWWILLLSFLPWHLIAPGFRESNVQTDGQEDSEAGLFRPAVVGVVAAFLAAQLVVSLLKIEVSPLISTYDMYSTTYGSPAEYEQTAADEYWVLGTDDATNVHECRISRTDADVLAAGAATANATSLAGQVARRCFEPSVHIRAIAVEGSRVRVDWEAWRPGQTTRVRLTDTIPVGP